MAASGTVDAVGHRHEHGHLAGDELLRIVGGRLSAVVGPGTTVARLGGDEFAVLLPEVDEVCDAHALAARIEAAVAEPIALTAGHVVTVGASIGVHLARRPYIADDLLHAADSAMYAVKDSHRSARQAAQV